MGGCVDRKVDRLKEIDIKHYANPIISSLQRKECNVCQGTTVCLSTLIDSISPDNGAVIITSMCSHHGI